MRYSKCQAYSERENIDTFKKVKEWKSKGLESRVGDERESVFIFSVIVGYQGVWEKLLISREVPEKFY